MGTPDFAVNPLHALAEAGYEVAGVVTQPDKPKGRGKTMLPTPVKEEALKHGFPVYQPVKVRDPAGSQHQPPHSPVSYTHLKAFSLRQLHSLIAHCTVWHTIHVFQLIYCTS